MPGPGKSMKRRAFIACLGGVAALPLVWPLPLRAQPSGHVRRIGVLMARSTDEVIE
jgi:hypothetical protein